MHGMFSFNEDSKELKETIAKIVKNCPHILLTKKNVLITTLNLTIRLWTGGIYEEGSTGEGGGGSLKWFTNAQMTKIANCRNQNFIFRITKITLRLHWKEYLKKAKLGLQSICKLHT